MQINVKFNQSSTKLAVGFNASNTQFAADFKNIQQVNADGVDFTVDETLSLVDGVLSVNRAETPEADNTLPITSAAVYTTVGNINALLETI